MSTTPASSNSGSFGSTWWNNFVGDLQNFDFGDVVNAAAGGLGTLFKAGAEALTGVLDTEAAEFGEKGTEAIGSLPGILSEDGAAGVLGKLGGSILSILGGSAAGELVAGALVVAALPEELVAGAAALVVVGTGYVIDKAVQASISTINSMIEQAQSSGDAVTQTLSNGQTVTAQPSGLFSVITDSAVLYYNDQAQLTNVLIQGDTSNPLFGTLVNIDNSTGTITATDIDGNQVNVQIAQDGQGISLINPATGAVEGTLTPSGDGGYTIASPSGAQVNLPGAESGQNPTAVQQYPNGEVATTTVDPADNSMTSVVTAANGDVLDTTSGGYNGATGQYQTTTTDASGNVTVQTTSTNADGSTSTTIQQYDSSGALTGSEVQTSTDNGNGSATIDQTDYDASGNVTGSSVETVTASSDGGYQSLTDTYDSAGNLQSVTNQTVDADGNSSTTTTNADGTKTTTTDNGTTSVTDSYNAAGQVVNQVTSNDTGPADTITESYSYNADGSLADTVTTDANGSVADTTYSYGSGYTTLDTTDTNSSGAVTGTVVETITPTSDGGYQSVSDAYGANGVLQSETVQTVDANGNSTSTTTNADGTKTTTTDDGTNTVTDNYDASGQLQSSQTVGDAGGADAGVSSSTSYQYDANGSLEDSYTSNSDGSFIIDQYGADGRLVNSEDYDAQGGVSATSYNSFGEVVSVYDQAADYGGLYTETNTYDDAGNLISSTSYDSPQQSGGPDGFGTSTTKTTYEGPDGPYSETTTTTDGQTTSVTDTSADGTDTTDYDYYPDGELESTDSTDTSPDGTVVSSTSTQYAQNADDSQTVTSSDSFGSEASATTADTTTNYDPYGDVTSISTSLDGDLGDGSYGSYGSGGGDGGDGGGGDGGGYAFAGNSLGGNGINVGQIALYDFTHGLLAAGVAAQNAQQQADISANSAVAPSELAALEGAKWGTKVVTWSLAGSAGPSAAPFSGYISSAYLSAIQSAFAAWSAATGITFEEVSDSSQSDIRLGWGSFQTSTTGVLGYTSFQKQGADFTGVTIRLEDPSEDALSSTAGSATYAGTQATLSQVLLHEIGHAIGLSDNSNPNSIMYSTLSADNTTLTSADMAAARALYGSGAVVGPSSTVDQYNAQHVLISSLTQNPDGSTSEHTYNAQGQVTSVDAQGADGSSNDSTYHYNPDGSYSVTVVLTPAGGGTPTTTVYDYDAEGNLQSGNGTTGGTTTDVVRNPDGSSVAYTYDAQGQLVAQLSTYVDGSTDAYTWSYGSDGSVVLTDVNTPAGGGAGSSRTQDYDAQGQLVGQQDVNTDGSKDAYTWSYGSDGSVVLTDVNTPAGGGAGSSRTQDYDAQGQLVGQQDVNTDGSTDVYTFSYGSDGSVVRTDVNTPAGGGAPNTNVQDYDSSGQLVNENSYTAQPDGSYSDYWAKDDGSQGSYWWDASTRQYFESWTNSDGSYFTDEYQYAAGGAPGVNGASFTETYASSDGSTGTRQYDAATNTTTVSYDSSQTGVLSSTTTGDAGFVGLQNQGELTNVQNDLTFFNPALSQEFAALLATH